MLDDQAFEDIRKEWKEDLQRTNWFQSPDKKQPLLARGMSSSMNAAACAFAKAGHLSFHELLYRKLVRSATRWRFLTIHFCYHKRGKSTGELAHFFNYADHNGISYALKRADELLQTRKWANQYEKVCRELG